MKNLKVYGLLLVFSALLSSCIFVSPRNGGYGYGGRGYYQGGRGYYGGGRAYDRGGYYGPPRGGSYNRDYDGPGRRGRGHAYGHYKHRGRGRGGRW
jgi:hypothetical protein